MTAHNGEDEGLLPRRPAQLLFLAGIVGSGVSIATEAPPTWTVLGWTVSVFAWHAGWPRLLRRLAIVSLCIALVAPAVFRAERFDRDIGEVWIPGWLIVLLCCIVRLQHVVARRELDESLARDELTGVLNRGSILHALRDRLRSDVFESRPSVLAFLDCDDLKTLNDQLGHVLADRMLRTVAQAIRSCLRSSDLVGRYGGDEFLIVLDRVQGAQARRVMQRVQQQVASATSLAGHPLTVSVGMTPVVAGRQRDESAVEEQIEKLVERADRLMYEAKSRGCGQLACDFDDGAAEGEF